MEFNLETILSILSGFGFLGFIISLIGYKRQRNQRYLLEFTEKQVADLEETIKKNKELLDSQVNRLAEQSRRIVWLETRIRQPKLASEEVLTEQPESDSTKLTMTERRHRVIGLASRGQNADSIAATLGMLPGEVELIINLNQAAQTVK